MRYEYEDAKQAAEEFDDFLFGEGAQGYDRDRFAEFVTHKLSGEPSGRPLNYDERVSAGLEV